jgi:hypothetical protein
MFSPFHPNLVVGGTYSGQILLWDTRAKSLPVLKSPLSASGHTHPVYSMTMIGTQNAHNLMSASTDGTVCAWQLDMLAQPQVLSPFKSKPLGIARTGTQGTSEVGRGGYNSLGFSRQRNVNVLDWIRGRFHLSSTTLRSRGKVHSSFFY